MPAYAQLVTDAQSSCTSSLRRQHTCWVDTENVCKYCTVDRGALIRGGICYFGKLCPSFCPPFLGGIFYVGISRMQYQHGSSASPCVTGWLLTGAVALITSRRQVRRRSYFEGRAPSAPYKGLPSRWEGEKGDGSK